MAYVSPEATLPVVENAIRNWKAYADSCYCHDKEAALKTVARLEALMDEVRTGELSESSLRFYNFTC